MPMPSHKSSLDTRLMRHSACVGDFHGLGHQPSPHREFPSGISLVNASLHESPLVEADALHSLLNFDSHPTVLVALQRSTLCAELNSLCVHITHGLRTELSSSHLLTCPPAHRCMFARTTGAVAWAEQRARRCRACMLRFNAWGRRCCCPSAERR
jgi:hypothetical protein